MDSIIELGQTGLLEAAAGQEDQKMVVPVVAQGMEVAEQQRGVKRTRRDRGSTAKDRISKMPPCAAGKRSSIYRGVTRHRWTGRYEAHLWDKSTWNQSQNKKGKQVYLGAYDEEEAAARAYDLAALKYWGPGTLINFPLTDYARDIDEMQNVTREEYLASLRRKSSGFSRGVSKYRGVARHHHNGRWEARIGRVFGNKYLYLGTYSTQEEAAAAYDMAAIEYRGLNAVTNFDLSRYIRWLRPGQGNSALHETDTTLSPNAGTGGGDESQLTGLTEEHQGSQDEHPQQHPVWPAQSTEPYQLPSLGLTPSSTQQRSSSSPTALSILLQSSVFKQMLERASAATPTECDSISNPGSEISHGIDEQQHQHPQQQQLQGNSFYSSWGKQGNHQQQAPALVEEEGPAHHSHDNSGSYHQSVTSNNHAIVGHHFADLQDHRQQQQQYAELLDHKQQQHYAELQEHNHQRYEELQDHKQQHYSEFHHRQQQQQHRGNLAVGYGHGYSHGPVPTLYPEQDSGASASIEDGSWAFTNVLPLSSAISTC